MTIDRLFIRVHRIRLTAVQRARLSLAFTGGVLGIKFRLTNRPATLFGTRECPHTIAHNQEKMTQPSAKSASLGQWNGQSALDLGPVCGVEEDWHELSFLASGAIDGCQKPSPDESYMNFFFFIFLTTSNALIRAFWYFLAQSQR